MSYTEKDYERFEEKMGRPNEVTGCIPWAGCYQSTGYGYFYLDGKMMTAHRAAHLLYIGPIPDGQLVHHKCERRSCCNFRHLEAVTYKQHMAIHYGE